MTDDIDHEDTESIVCPWCGYEYTKDDSWYSMDGDPEHSHRVTCESCGKPFRAQVEAWYTTFKVETEEASE